MKKVKESQVYMCEIVKAIKGNQFYSWYYEGQGQFIKGWADGSLITCKELTKQLNKSIKQGWNIKGVSKDGEEVINL